MTGSDSTPINPFSTRTKPLYIRIDKDLHDKIKAMADGSDTTMAKMCNHLLRMAMELASNVD